MHGSHSTTAEERCVFLYRDTTYVYVVLILFFSSVFDHISSYARHLSKSILFFAEEGRPDTVVEVWARFEQY